MYTYTYVYLNRPLCKFLFYVLVKKGSIVFLFSFFVFNAAEELLFRSRKIKVRGDGLISTRLM